MSPAPRRPPATPLQVRLCCLALGLVATFTVLHNQRQVGIARDETVYFAHGSQYAAWWRGVMSGQRELGEASITATFGGPGATDNNREHPPLIKTASGMSEHWLHDRLGLLDELTAYRLPSAVLHGLLVALVAAFASGAWGLLAGVVSALAMLLMPRALFHAGLACFDGPITALWFATLWAYHRALTSPRVAWLAGALFGLALATKHNALLLPLALAPHYLAVSWRAGLRRRLYLPLSFAVLGPLVLVALWPWLWFEPLPHLWQWISCLLYTSPSPRDGLLSRMPSSA